MNSAKATPYLIKRVPGEITSGMHNRGVHLLGPPPLEDYKRDLRLDLLSTWHLRWTSGPKPFGAVLRFLPWARQGGSFGRGAK